MRSLTILLFATLITMLFACSSRNEDVAPTANHPNSPEPTPQVAPQPLPPRTVAVGDVRVSVTLASNEVTRGIGLSDRDDVPAGTGMLFVYSTAAMRSFWMKGCRIGLDIAYLGDDGRIFQIGSLDPPGPDTTDAEMPRLVSEAPARFVLETRKGWMAASGIRVGDRVRFSEDIDEVVKDL